MSARVTITLPERVLDRLDAIASAEGLSRSEVVREAASSYLSQRDREGALSARMLAVHEGIAWLEDTARTIPEGTPHSLELLHEVRAQAGGPGEPFGPGAPSGSEPL